MSTTDLQERLQKSARTLCWSGSPPSYSMAALLHEAAEAVAERDRVHAALVARVINAEVALNELYTVARQMDIERNRHGEPSTPKLAQFEEALKRTGQYFRDPGNQSNEDGVCGDCESDEDED